MEIGRRKTDGVASQRRAHRQQPNAGGILRRWAALTQAHTRTTTKAGRAICGYAHRRSERSGASTAARNCAAPRASPPAQLTPRTAGEVRTTNLLHSRRCRYGVPPPSPPRGHAARREPDAAGAVGERVCRGRPAECNQTQDGGAAGRQRPPQRHPGRACVPRPCSRSALAWPSLIPSCC